MTNTSRAIGKASLEQSGSAPQQGAAALVEPVGKYASIPQILIKKDRQRQTWRDFIHKAWKDEGLFQRYCQMEKYKTELRIRAVGRHMQDFKQNNKSEWRLTSALPARDWFRMMKVDPHFQDCKRTMKRLKSDNPNLCIYDP